MHLNLDGSTGKLQVILSSKIAIAFHSSSYSKGGAFSCVAQALSKPVTTTKAVITTKNPSPSCACGIKGQVIQFFFVN